MSAEGMKLFGSMLSDTKKYIPRVLRCYIYDLALEYPDDCDSSLLENLEALRARICDERYIKRELIESMRKLLALHRDELIEEGLEPETRYFLKNGRINPKVEAFLRCFKNISLSCFRRKIHRCSQRKC